METKRNLLTVAAVMAVTGLPGKQTGGEVLYRCPRHEDAHPSLSINPAKNVWMCGPCSTSGNAWALAAWVSGHSADDKPAVSAWLRENGLLNGGAERKISAVYQYHDKDGNPVYEVVRFEPKDFRQRRSDGNGGYTWNLQGVERVLYNLPEVHAAEYVFVVEGEKDADQLSKLGLTATTNAGGCGKWCTEYSEALRGKYVTVIPDNDQPGRDHAAAMARSLFGKAASVKVLDLPGLPDKGDVSDWLQGQDPEDAAEELSRLSEAAQEWKPESRFKIGSAAQALKPQPDIEWVLRNFIGRRWVSIVCGEPGSKKTWALLDLVVCVASSEPWLSFSGPRTPVLWVDEESGEGRLLRRLGDAMRGHNAPADIPLHYVSLLGLNLTTEGGAQDLAELLEEVKPGLLVIDALSDIMLGGDENLVKDTQPIMHRLRQLAERHDCAVIVIHHVNKSGGYRGSSALKGAVDSLLLFESRPDSPIITVSCEKARDIIIPTFSAHAHFEIGSFRLAEADIGTTRTANLGPSERYVLRFLENGPATIRAIMDGADSCSPETARRAVYKLADAGRVRRADTGQSTGRGNEAKYEAV